MQSRRPGNQQLFSYAILPAGKRRWRSFGAGFFIELTILATAVWVPVLFPQQMADARQYLMTQITAPPIDFLKPKPLPRPAAKPRFKPAEVAKVEPVDPPKPKIIQPVFEKPIAAKPVVKKIIRAPELKEWAKAMPTVNPLANSETDLKRPKAPVQTGGFGDPNGLPAANKMTQAVNINQTGAFDMPPGPGKGNGTGGARGREGVVASAGFGDETAVASSGPRVRKAADDTPAQDPVVILSKPQPEYTAEARQKKIQGEVLLQVVFTAAGRVEVERVVRGLGYGLDENAEAAARQIQFKAARRNGQPVDFPAIVRIEFELAY